MITTVFLTTPSPIFAEPRREAAVHSISGIITLTTTRSGLEPATVKIESHPVAITGGLMRAGN